MQRLSVEPGILKLEGFQFVTDVDPEMHYLLKAVLLRAIHLGPPVDGETRHMRMLRAYRELCTAPDGDEPWPALNGGPSCPGPFQRGWRQYHAKQLELAERGREKIMIH